MRIPNPKAVTTTEAYLAYKAEVLEQSELKDKLYHPYLHIDGWLAYWTGLTATYPTDKNGDPECLTDEEAYIAYLAGVTSEYPEALKDPADVRVASYLRYLISARFGRPDYPVTREEFYLSMMKPRFIPSGDPSSSIEIDGTVEAEFVDVKMYGDTFQQTYSGKNLMPATFFSSSIDGLVVTNDGKTINISGTANRAYPGITNGTVALPATIPNGTVITLSMTRALPSGTRLYMRVYPESGSSYKDVSIADNETSVTVTLDRNFARTQFLLGTTSGTQFDITNLGIQVEANSSATSFEPYVGGTASPNPDYPQEIQTVTGEQTVSVHGKNLLPSTGLTQIEYNGVTYTPTYDDDGRLLFITLNGVATGGAGFTIGYIDFKGGETYTASGLTGGSNSTYRVWFDSSYAFPAGNRLFMLDGDRTATALEDETNVRAYVQIFPGAVLDGVVVYPQVELGSASTNYEPYQAQSYPISLGSTELCKIGDYQDYIYKSGDDWYVHKETGKVVLDGSEASLAYTKGVVYGDILQSQTSNAICDYYIYGGIAHNTSEAYKKGNNKFSTHDELERIYIRNDSLTSLANWQTWLNTHNTTVYYALATATDTKITDSTLKGQLESIIEGGSYEGKTYIKVTATDPNLPGLLYVEAAV